MSHRLEHRKALAVLNDQHRDGKWHDQLERSRRRPLGTLEDRTRELERPGEAAQRDGRGILRRDHARECLPVLRLDVPLHKGRIDLGVWIDDRGQQFRRAVRAHAGEPGPDIRARVSKLVADRTCCDEERLALRRVAGLLAATTSLLRNRLDKQMRRFKKPNPVFYQSYLSARVIVHKGAPAKPAPPPPPTPPPPTP